MIRLFCIASIMFLAFSASAEDVKDADLAGSWYPASKAELESMLSGYLDSAKPEKIGGRLFALISPHAGYRFSGPVAAYGFDAAKGRQVKTVIILGFSHRKLFDGIAIYDKGSWRTPLGDIRIDEELAGRIIACNARFRPEQRLFDGENSVEMQVPFVQVVFPEAMIVPVAFGTQNYNDAMIAATALAAVLKNRNDVLVVSSTDLSHYHPYDEANAIDGRMIGLLEAGKAQELFDAGAAGDCELCGLMPVTATLLTAERLGFDKIKVLKYANSGDTFGDKTKVVGYLSAVIYREGPGKEEGKEMLNDAQRKRLLEIARESIVSFVRDGKTKDFTESDPVLNESMGAFVTLHEAGELRGCIGNMIGQGPLYKTVSAMAIEAATGDPRFPALSPAETDKIDIEISVLSPMKRVTSHEEIKVPGHGVLVRRGFRSGVYLPQVATETGWNKEEFLTSLCGQKAGLAPDSWKDPSTELYTFSAEVFGEKDGR